jgi:hypothetical protein
MKYPTFDFVREKVIEYSDTLGSYEDEIEYLEWIKTEHQTKPPRLDPNTRNPITFIEFIEKNIKYREELLERLRNETIENKRWAKITGDMIDITRIFEGMKKVNIIDIGVKTPQLIKLFFTETDEIKAQSKIYNARKKDLNKLLPYSNSEKLKIFVLLLITNSFAGKEDILIEIREHIKGHLEDLQKRTF